MAFLYYLYDTDYGNTIVDKGVSSFTPVLPYAELHINYDIPNIQPLYLYAVSGSSIVVNLQTNIDAYLNSSGVVEPPTADGNVTYGEFTGTTTALSATTTALELNKVNVSGDTMTGTLYFGGLGTGTTFGSIGKTEGYSGLKIGGLAGISLNAPYWVNPQWSAYTGSYLTIGGDGLITITTSATGATSWQSTGGTNSIVKNVPEDLNLNVTPTKNVNAGTIEWNIEYTADNHDTDVTLQLVVNATPLPNGIKYRVAKNQTSKLYGTYPIISTYPSGTTISILITAKENGVVNRSLLRLSQSGSASANVRWGNITGALSGQTDLQAALNLKLNKSIYQTYTGTTAPATYLSKSAFNIYSGTTVPNTYYNKTQINSYSATTLININSRLLTSAFNSYSATTLTNINSRLLTSAFNGYSANTLTNINSRLLTSTFNTWSGSTLPNTYLKRSTFATYTGTTVPNTYYNKTQINSYTGATATAIGLKANIASPTFTGTVRSVTPTANDNSTCIATTAWYFGQSGNTTPVMDGSAAIGTSLRWSHADHVHPSDTTRLAVSAFNTYSANTLTNINSRLLTSTFNTWSGSTLPNTYLTKSSFNTWSGGTLPANYYNKTQINVYTGATLTNINSRLLTSTFNTWSGGTLPNTYYNKTQINSYTGSTLTNINSRLLTSVFNSYSANTLTNINSRLLTSTFNTWSGNTLPNTYLKRNTFATYTGTTAPAQFASKANAITGATNLGSGNGALYTTVSGNKINLKTLVAGSGMVIQCNANCITLINPVNFGWSNLVGGSTVIGCGTLASGSTLICNTYIGVSAGAVTSTGCENIAIGTNSLECNTIGSYNTAIGHYAIQCSVNASYNVGIGYGALRNVSGTDATSNVAIGYQSQCNRNSGWGNLSIGMQSMQSNINGCRNTAIGAYSLFCSTGSNNFAIGYGALWYNTIGCCNLGIGNYALYCNTGGTGNIGIGRYSGAFSTGSNQLFIGNNSGCTLIGGDFSVKCVDICGVLKSTANINASTYVCSPIITGSSCVIAPNIYATTSLYEGGTALSGKYASKALAITGATNLGTATPIYTSVSTNKLQFKSLSGGSGISISNTANAITICSTVTQFNWSGTTANGVGTYVSASCIKSNPNMTFNGTALSITGNINASTYMCSPVITGSTKVCSPIVFGTTCVQSALVCSTGQVKGTIISGSTCVCAPTICASTLLYSAAKTCLIGATTGSTLFLTTTPPAATMQQPTLFYDTVTKQIEAKRLTGGSDQYFYTERTTNATTTSTTCQKALGLTGTTLAGRYEVTFSAEYGNATANACTFGAFKIDNTTQGTNLLTRDNVANNNRFNTFSRDVTLTAASHCFDIWFWNTGGTACVPISSIRVKRIC
jgi:hypothetical protein